MDSSVKQILDSFGYSIKNYTSSLGLNNEKLIKAKEMYERLVKQAEGGADIIALSQNSDFSQIGMLIGELASEPALSVEELAEYGDEIKSDDVPSASVPAAGYHMAYNVLSPEAKQKMGRYYERIFEIERESENAIFFNAALAEDGVLLNMSREPLIQAAEDTLKQAESIHSPTVNYQQKLTIETYKKVKTIAELEFEGTKMAELSNVEHEWDGLFIETIGLLPACAAAIEAFGTADELVEKLKNSYKFMSEFMGIMWEDVFKNKRYLYFWENVAWPRIPEQKKLMHNAHTSADYAAMLKRKFFDPFIKDEPVPEKAPDTEKAAVLWGKTVKVEDVLDALSNPPRPDLSKKV